MNAANSLDTFITAAAGASMASIAIPPANHAAIAQRAHRAKPMPKPARMTWYALAAAAIVLALLFVPPVSQAIARAVHSLITITYFPVRHGAKTDLARGRNLTLAQARQISAFKFVEPHGLPQGYQLISIQAPPIASNVVILRYSTRGSASVVITERPVAGRRSQRCFALKSTSPLIHISHYRGGAPPAGLSALPCRAWTVENTQLMLIAHHGELTQSQLQGIINSTK